MVDVQQKDGVTMVKVSGNMELNRALEIEEVINEHISKGIKSIFIDLNAVTYLSSSGIRVLVSTLRQLKELSGRMVLFDPSEIVLKTLKIVEMDGLFYITSDRNDALGSLESK